MPKKMKEEVSEERMGPTLTREKALEAAAAVERFALEAAGLEWTSEEDILVGHFKNLSAAARAVLKAKDQVDRVNGPRERERADAE